MSLPWHQSFSSLLWISLFPPFSLKEHSSILMIGHWAEIQDTWVPISVLSLKEASHFMDLGFSLIENSFPLSTINTEQFVDSLSGNTDLALKSPATHHLYAVLSGNSLLNTRCREKGGRSLGLPPAPSHYSLVQLCLTLCNPMDYIVHGILQARKLEWITFPFSRGSSQPRN